MVLLQERIARQAELRPSATAIVEGESTLTYGELEEGSNRLARLLIEAGARPGDRVCLFIPKSRQAVMAMLASLKAGCAYVPIDTSCPPARVARIVRACEPSVVAVARSAAPLLDATLEEAGLLTRPQVVSVEKGRLEGRRFSSRYDLSRLAFFPGSPLRASRSPRDPAHILFTSGSTGAPKGVLITHQNVGAFLDWALPHFGLGPEDRISCHPPLHFDLSTFDIHGGLSAGAELHLVPPELSLLPHRLVEMMERARLTQWFSVPSILTYLARFDALAGRRLPSLKRLMWCGETMPTPTLIYWMERLPHVRFTNLYGPTETTIASSHYTVPEVPRDPRAPIPIGAPCAGEELMVLDASLEPARPGEVGELYIAGAGLSPGYHRDPARTEAAFIRRPLPGDPSYRLYRTGDLARVGPDGLLYLVGRSDSQIKSRGYRIELGEIEAALHGLDCLAESCVVGIPTDGFEGTAIGCALVFAGNHRGGVPEVREELARLLPSYMLPTRWLELSALPRNGNGKIDRRAIREAFEAMSRKEPGEVREERGHAAG